MLPYEIRIGLRYTRAKRRNHFISFISVISMAGIALGIMALIVVLSVMNGFQDELRTRILGVASHLEITGSEGRLTNWPALAREVARHPEVRGFAPYINAQALLSASGLGGGETKGSLIRGLLPQEEDKVAEFDQKMQVGRLANLSPGAWGIILGADLARALGVVQGDRVTVIAPQGVVTPAGMIPRIRQFTVVGIFRMGMYEYDAGLALMHLADAQKLYRMGDTVSGLRVKLADMERAPWVTRALAHSLHGDYYLSDWTMSHQNFFQAVQIEKRMMFIILTLIVAVAAFNIVSTLVMVVTDKQADIAILRTLGASPKSIMAVFMVQGSLIGVIGTMLGIASGVLLAVNVETIVPWIERAVGMNLFPSDVYYISKLPSRLVWRDVATIAGVALTLAFLATLYPSWRAASVQPAEALRYE
ncbi:MAG TPA: lipoprotein-releasing ABC transporter permease subunit [Thiobacillaceae bacterium]|nr:lipoprotein-releasing ABC transporter permease subunit [Thiobacillaceae bacterium]HNU65167.1 lipoprotein-releasing ABC transporter permease subunit [Thiobacillaceae bacterium]